MTKAERLAGLFDCFDDPRDRALCAVQYARTHPSDLESVAAASGLSEAELSSKQAPQAPRSILHRALVRRNELLECAADEASRETLRRDLEEVERVLENPTTELAPSENGSSPATSEVKLTVRGRTLDLVYPRHPQSVLLLTEVFVDGDYWLDFPGDVTKIYDIGANIGLATLCFSIQYPNANITCVEPSPKNLALLRENVARNGVRAEVVPAAVADRRGTIDFFEFDAHAINSTVFSEFMGKTGRKMVVDALPISEVVVGKGYGLKLDIEGGEFELLGHASAFENAAWICGEVHFSPEVTARAKAFLALLRRCFDIRFDEPLVGLTGLRAAQSFRGVNRLAAP